MRILVAGRNAAVLAKVAGTFANNLQIATATSKADCFALLASSDFALIIACETLADGTGLEVLSHVVVNTPNTLRIFAARPATLDLLRSELGFFGLFRTLPYPINFRKLWAAISLAQAACDEQAPGAVPTPGPMSPAHGSAASIRHVVLENTWEVEALSTLAPQEPLTQQQQQPTQLHEVMPGMRAAARYAAAHAAPVAVTAPARIPESEAFKRARARREAANLNAPNREVGNRDTANSNAAKREPVISNHSLADLAKRFATQRPLAQFVRARTGIKRAVLLVGSGAFVAINLAVLTLFIVNVNKSTKPAKLSMIASVNQPLPHKVFPWQPETQLPTRQAASMGSEGSPAAVADLEAKPDEASETPDDDPDHPVRPPDAPPQLS